MSQARECDVLVVGRGAAGCLTSALLAEAGADVLMVGREATATALSTGRIDLAGLELGREISRYLIRLGEGHGLFQGPQRTCRAITNHGTVIRQTLSSSHDWVLPDGNEEVAVVSLLGNPDLDPLLMCAAMAIGKGMLPCHPYRSNLVLPLCVPTKRGRSLGDDATATVEALAAVVSEIDENAAVIPPLFSGPGCSLALDRLERSSGHMVMEAATPLSNPGRRLQRCLEDGAVGAGCTLWKDRELRSLRWQGDQAVEATLRSGLRELQVRPRAIILATGNLVAGGLTVEGQDVADPLGLFATAWSGKASVRSPRLGRALSSGIGTLNGRAVLQDGTVARNIYVTGSAVPGTSYPLGKGLGYVMADAWTKAAQVREAL